MEFRKLPIVIAGAAIVAVSMPAAASSVPNCQNLPFPDAWIYKSPAANADEGASVELFTKDLSVAHSGTWVKHYLFYGLGSNGGTSVEVGVRSDSPHKNYVYWADSRGRGHGGNHTHVKKKVSWSFSQWYPVKVETAGSCTWDVSFNNAHIGRSVKNCPAPAPQGRDLIAGLSADDVRNSDSQVDGEMHNWSEKNSKGWSNGWDGTSFSAVCPAEIQYTATGSGITEEGLHASF